MRTALLAGALACGITNAAWAVGSLVDVSVYDRAENRTLPVYHHEGRYYVVGRPGNEYRISIRNGTRTDMLAVVSVDGVNAVTGETANWTQSGYVLGPWMTYDIKGWRKTLQRTAAFYFTEQSRSYAARTGRPDNTGLIGVAVFRAKSEPAVGMTDSGRRKQGAPAPAQGAAKDEQSDSLRDRSPNQVPMPEASLGTGHGRSEQSPVRYASFERAASAPDEIITIYYDSYRNLVAQGVVPAPARLARPLPFPGSFVPDPN